MTVNIKNFIAMSGGDIVGVHIEISHDGNCEQKIFKLLTSQYSNLKLSKGEISPLQCDEIESASKICEAYLKGLNILSFGSNTAHTMVLKLSRRGIDRESAMAATEILKMQGYINEYEDVRREIERCLRKSWGSKRILAHLHQKGFDDEAIGNADDDLFKIDFAELCLELLESKWDEIPKDISERQKIVAFLARYGYTMSEIKYAFSNFGRR